MGLVLDLDPLPTYQKTVKKCSSHKTTLRTSIWPIQEHNRPGIAKDQLRATAQAKKNSNLIGLDEKQRKEHGFVPLMLLRSAWIYGSLVIFPVSMVRCFKPNYPENCHRENSTGQDSNLLVIKRSKIALPTSFGEVFFPALPF